MQQWEGVSWSTSTLPFSPHPLPPLCVALSQRRLFTGVKGKPVVIMTLKGEKPELPSILLNSHVDVVPVFEVRPPPRHPGLPTAARTACRPLTLLLPTLH